MIFTKRHFRTNDSL